MWGQTPNLHFDGVDDRVTLPNGLLNTIGTGDFTVEAWVRGTEGEQLSHPRILSNRDAIDNGFMLGFHGVWGGSAHKMLNLQLDGLNYILINNGSFNASILDGTCHHVAVSKGADSLRFYVDGIHIGSKVLQGAPSTTTTAQNMVIGDDVPDPQPFNGNISQVRLWDHVREQAAIAADMNYGVPGSTTGLLGCWPLSAGAGQVAEDITGEEAGMLGGTTAEGTDDPVWIPDGCAVLPPPSAGRCLSFDGLDDRVSMPNNILGTIGTGPLTVEAWVRGVEADQLTHPRILSGRDQIDNGLLFGFHGVWGGSAHKMLNLQLDGLNYILINNGSFDGNILDGTCHHVAVAKDADSVRFYVDGAHIGSKVLQGNPSAATGAATMLIGNDGPDPQPFNGNISQVRLWDHARTGAQIMSAMNVSIPGSTQGLAAYWELNDGTGQGIIDKTGNSPGSLGSGSGSEAMDPQWEDDCCDSGPTHTGMAATRPDHGPMIHPNPVRDLLRVEVPTGSGAVTLSIVDATGRVVLSGRQAKMPRTVIDLSHLPTGLYVLHLHGPAGSFTEQFLKE